MKIGFNSRSAVFALAFGFVQAQALDQPIDFSRYQASSPVKAEAVEDGLRIDWPIDGHKRGEVVFDFESRDALIRSVRILQGETETELFESLRPQYAFWLGQRDLELRDGWMIFFDKTHERPFAVERAVLDPNRVRVISEGSRCQVAISTLKALEFEGELRFVFYPGGRLIQMTAAVSTDRNARAFLYHSGLTFSGGEMERVCWIDPEDVFQRRSAGNQHGAPLRTRYRAVIAESESGSIAVFPPPHQYLYPLDFADNFGWNWMGRDYLDFFSGFGIGIRQPPYGDRRFVPWINAPPGTEQQLTMFLLVDDAPAEEALEKVKRYTHGDRFADLPGYMKFTSHYHVEHATDFMNKQREQGADGVPEGLENPEFVQTFKKMGLDIAHLSEFHFGRTPRLQTEERLEQLQVMHQECERLSDESFLLLPGEEPNAHLGGHWISLFPKPINWVLNRREGTPFFEDREEDGPTYHVGSKEDVLELFRREN